MSKQFLAILAAIVLVFVGIVIFQGSDNKDNKSSKGSQANATKHIEGNTSSGITLLEYGDYQCPYCGQYYPVVKQVVAKYTDQISFQFRNFPLVNAHPNAFAGARAAEAADLQGKFWEMHDLLYENQSTWSASTDPTSYFKQYAKALGLDVTKFQTDFASSKVNDRINADMAIGNDNNVGGTPTFYLNGKLIQVGESVDAFSAEIDKVLAKQKGTTTPATDTSSDTSGETQQTQQTQQTTE